MPRHGNGYAISRDLTSRLVEVAGLKPLGRATRRHPAGQIRKLVASLDRFGFVLPMLIDSEHRVVAGWALLLAAKQLGFTQVPAIRVTELSEADLRALRLALNRVAEDADWDREELALEFSEIRVIAPEIELQVTGFDVAEIDGIVHDGGADQEDHLDEIPSSAAGYVPVTLAGDLWILDRHRLLCGDASKAESYDRLLGTGKARMMFADLRSDVPVEGQVSGSGTVKNGEFATVPGEPSSAEFLPFLTDVFTYAARCSTDGAYHFVCTDWPHAKGVILAGEEIYGKPVDLCVWNKTNADRNPSAGTLYLPQRARFRVQRRRAQQPSSA